MNESSGIKSLDLLTIVFVVLKLTNVINWSWWWVLSPTLLVVVLWLLLRLAVIFSFASLRFIRKLRK